MLSRAPNSAATNKLYRADYQSGKDTKIFLEFHDAQHVAVRYSAFLCAGTKEVAHMALEGECKDPR